MDRAQVNDTAARIVRPAAAKKPEQESGSANGSKRRALRRDPEKRRLQNIQAQKKYREKLRKRLEDLETLAAAVAQSKSQQPLPLASPPRETPSPPAPSNTASLSTGDKNGQAASVQITNHVTPLSPLSDAILNDWIALEGNATAQTRALSTTTAFTHNSNDSNNQQLAKPNKNTSATDSSWGWDLQLWDASAFFAPHQQTYTRQKESWAADSEEQQHYNNMPFGLSCNCSDRADGLHPRLFYTTSSSNSSNSSSTSSSTGSRNSYRDCRAHRIVLNSQARGAPFFQPSPDPMASNIRVEMLCNISAMWANCLHVGISDPVFCDDDSISSFYRAPPAPSSSSSMNMIQNSDNHQLIPTTNYTHSDKEAEEARIRTVQSIFKTLKPDLRPIREQITHIHHPVIDCLPFPTLRRNVLLSLASNTFDEEEMCDDLLLGLICWGRAGGGAGSRRDLNTSTGKAPANSGTPWDSRSWQAKPWFLRKYWVLLGGEEGELVRQSEWWRSVRGEEEDIWACA